MNVERYITFNDEDIMQNKPDVSGVINRATLENLYDTKLSLTFDSDELKEEFTSYYLPLRYHFTIPLHILKDKAIQADVNWLNNVYQPIDERIVFIKEG